MHAELLDLGIVSNIFTSFSFSSIFVFEILAQYFNINSDILIGHLI